MNPNLPAPIHRLFRREAGIIRPGLIYEFDGRVRRADHACVSTISRNVLRKLSLNSSPIID